MEFKVTTTRLHMVDTQTKPCDGAYLSGKDEYKPWAIEIKSIQELCELVEENGEIIIGKDDDGLFSLEIYNDYRE